MRSTLVTKPFDAADRRQAKRHVTTRKVSKLVRNCGDELCVLRNLSTHGAKADVAKAYHVNEKVLLSLRRNDFVAARVAWVGNRSIGMEFYEPIEREAVLANLFEEEKRAGSPRVETLADATILLGADCYQITVGNLSQKGARIIGGCKLKSGNALCLELAGIGSVPAVVRWSDATKAGILFDHALPLWDMMRWIKAANRVDIALPNVEFRLSKDSRLPD